MKIKKKYPILNVAHFEVPDKNYSIAVPQIINAIIIIISMAYEFPYIMNTIKYFITLCPQMILFYLHPKIKEINLISNMLSKRIIL